MKLSATIVDIAAGYNHCLALTDKKEVIGWGKRMGVYQSFYLDYHSIVNSFHV